MTLVARDVVRKRPGMFCGDPDHRGVLNLAHQLLGNALDQYLAGRCTRIDVRVDADGTITVEDNGPGIPFGRDGFPAVDALLENLSVKPTVDGDRPHVHLWLAGVGLAAVTALSERFELTSIREGVETRAVYARGVAIEPVRVHPVDRSSGTRITFRPDPEIFSTIHVSAIELTRQLDELSYLAPWLRLSWAIASDPAAARGLAAYVEREAPRREVVHHRGTYATDNGPVEVEVALAWTGYRAEPVLHSFVNLARTRGHGEHVAGLLDAVRELAPARDGDRGLVAAVSVLLDDVLYGDAAKDRLDSPHARPAVAAATRAALANRKQPA